MSLIQRSFVVVIALGLCGYAFFSKPFQLGLDLKGGVSVVLEAQDVEDRPVTNEDMLGIMGVIHDRVNAIGLTEPVIQRKGIRQVVVELPGVQDVDRALSLIGETARLTFHRAQWGPQNIKQLTVEQTQVLFGDQPNLVYFDQELANGDIVHRPLIIDAAEIDGSMLKEAFAGTDSYGRPVVNIAFNSKGAQLFYDVTNKSIGQPVAILLDGVPISAPNVNEAIRGGRAVISGSFSPEDVKDLVIKLRAGSLPVPVKIVSNRVIGPTLGMDSIVSGSRAMVIGLLGVVIYMIVFFRFFGVIAVVALLFYVFSTLSVLKLIDATFTLPGIAGLILTVGMAVDANIIIFSRIREELSENALIKAVTHGFSKAYISIIDSNVTTLFAAMVLFWLGTGTIKGFALTLTIGILMSAFSALFVTQYLILLTIRFIKFPKWVLMKSISND